MTARQYQMPPQLEAMLLEFTVNVLVSQPADLAAFAVRYFSQLKRHSTGSAGASQQLSPGDSVPSRRWSAASDHSSVFSEDEAPPRSSANRRKSVFAEAYNPEDDEEEAQKVMHPKSDVQRARLADAVRNIFLFRSLDQAQMQEVLDAMFERKVSPGESVIEQGDDGDNFYVIESGKYSIYVQPDGAAAPKKVGGYDSSGSFGELALMYNLPRAATIQADTAGSLWAMDRKTFRRIVLKNAFKKRKMYEQLLETVPMLKTLEPYERMNLADALVPQTFRNGEIIIEQGDDADGMYFVEEGTVRIMRAEHNQEEQQINSVSKGGYLGELALLTNRPRAASAYADGSVRLAFLDREAFERLLGPCMDVMKREVHHYEEELRKVFGTDVHIDDLK